MAILSSRNIAILHYGTGYGPAGNANLAARGAFARILLRLRSKKADLAIWPFVGDIKFQKDGFDDC
ncbi:hypothetical protein [Mangrovicoccus ximenensis]|uniref:hypothetical protein n=1 Tax=Mangrovicoccus ximenensis TaxID=1911570 RepID=UPI0011AE912B|nr:hypothetical protein [Mangrovicoccus ximenensis]